MYVDTSKSQGKYVRYLLRENYRENGKIKHRTIANISRCSDEEIEAIRLALKHKKDLSSLVSLNSDLSLFQGLSIGAVWLVYDIARQLGITKALGPSREGKLALWQVIARVIDQGSRLSAVRLAGSHAACDILGLDIFNEDDLYANLDWLYAKQAVIENRLLKQTYPDKKPELFLYDVTSSYLEGTCNELGAFGYNRDGKKGKKQIVIGLLCDEVGRPLSIEVFAGNTHDTGTFAIQIRKVAERFGGGEVTFVGDRGMIKSRQIKDLLGHGFHYITAITKPQIETLLSKGTIQMGLFDKEIAEVEDKSGIRYVLRRNPIRAEEIQQSRSSKLKSLEQAVKKQNAYLEEHPRAHLDVALRKIKEYSRKLRISKWIMLSVSERKIFITVDQSSLDEEAKLDGCYVIKTDLQKEVANKKIIHDRYKDLTLVEWAFRTSKTVELEIRPVHVRLAKRTRGHAFVIMLAYRIVQELANRWSKIDLTVDEAIKELSTLCATEMKVKGKSLCNKIPEPRESISKLLKTANVKMPEALSCRGIKVATRKKLPERRKSH
ncbi:IS1634 family transposase [Candidatus Pacearchaeota archaeon]|nr:IS1634 family transposase [Candidatus Pacearchaeota archaeon]